jgi:hypothetical protein
MSRIAILFAIGAIFAGCAGLTPAPTVDEAPWKTSGGEVITAAPDAGGVLSFRNCPTLDEARAAMPAVTGGPDANGVPFKSMVLQCSYTLPGNDVQGRPAGISILVFDATAEGGETWGWTLGEEFGSPEPVSDLGESAFVTWRNGEREVWVNAGRFGFHVLSPGPSDLQLDQVLALARVAVEGLARPPR